MATDLEKFSLAENAIARQINSYLGLTGISLRELAKTSGVSAARIGSIRARQGNPTLSTLIKLEHAIDRKLTIEF